MRWIYKLPLRFRSLSRKSRVEHELTEELHFHLERLIEEKVGNGITPAEARYRGPARAGWRRTDQRGVPRYATGELR
jgi:hypothetical protein